MRGIDSLLKTRVPDFLKKIDERLQAGDSLELVLTLILSEFGAESGTIHFLCDGILLLVAHVGIPQPVLDKIERVPIGKGMAGLAAQRLEPVQVCNLQTDDSGVARAGARATAMKGSIAVPILVEGELRGVLGIAKADEHEWSAYEQRDLLGIAATLGSSSGLR